MEARVGIKYEEKNFLFKINKKTSLKENIEAICCKNSLMASQSYGLKFTYTPSGINLGNYVTEENFGEIQDGFTLKLVESLDSVIERIFHGVVHDRQQTFQDIFTLSTDPGFIKALVRKGRVTDILNWLTDKYLSGKELSACLLTLLHLLKKQYVKEVPPAIVENIIRCIKNDAPPTPPSELQYALAVLCQILYLRGHELNKQMIILKLSINDLVPFIWSQEHSNLQLNTMMLINAMVKSLKGDKRTPLIRQLNRSQNRDYIFNNIIKTTNVEGAMAHELYVYQTYILSLHSEELTTYIDPSTKAAFKDLESCEDNSSRVSTFLDFEEVSRSRCSSTGTILEEMENIRVSFASMDSEKSCNSEVLSYQHPASDNQISRLADDCLTHYKNYHHKNFCKSRIEENTYEPGIYISSQRVTKLLAKILHIGCEPSRTSQSYSPLVFNGSLKLPFFLELFSRTMWLLSKTRREMKAWTFDDYPKVLVVLEKQIRMVLEKKPVDYNSLTEEMMKITYDMVDKQWQKERAEEWKIMYKRNPSVQELKQRFRSENENLIFEKRMKTLQQGDLFPKLPEKRGRQQYFYLKLSDNKRMVIWGDWDETMEEFKFREPERFKVSDVKHFVTGNACPHVKDHSVKHPDRAFSLILEEGTIINCLAKDARVANLWIDGFNLLLDKTRRSVDYQAELETLLEMDCALHLLELQNIPIPNTPPAVPPLPPNIPQNIHRLRSKPAVPPKSPNIMMRKEIHKGRKKFSYHREDSLYKS